VPTHIAYATKLICPQRLDTRLPYARQSAAAAELLERLAGWEGPPRAFSKSHSRAAVAAAITPNPHISVGVDIEWMAPERPVAAIARSLMDDDAPVDITVADFYRLWTFYEAHFKATQCAPPRPAMLEFIAARAGDGVRRLGDGTHVVEHRVTEDFQLCLVWRGIQADCVPRYLGCLTIDS
jgi:hypothetical protein